MLLFCFLFRFERQICVDQEGCSKPDTKTNFASKEDAVKRLIRYNIVNKIKSLFKIKLDFYSLLRYHCMYEEVKEEKSSKDESEMEIKAQEYLGQYQDMLHKYQYLLLKQSQVKLHNI